MAAVSFRRLALAAAMIAVFSHLVPIAPARAQVEIDITQGQIQPVAIAVSPLAGDADYGSRIAEVAEADLERSGLFRPIDRAAFIQSPAEMNPMPRFADWRQVNASVLVNGLVRSAGGRLDIEFRLWDVFAGEQMTGLRFTTEAANWRRVAHRIADAVYQRVTGESGYFDTRIVYISETGPKNDRIKRLAIMDQDGANHRFLTDGRSLVLTPRFDPTGEEVAYMAYRGPSPRVYVHDLATGQERVLGDYAGMTFAPRFAPSGNEVALSLAQNGNTDIYLQTVGSAQARRLTDSPAIDTSPSFSPDGQRIVFNSDRAGSQQLYVMDRSGGNPTRISFGEGRYGTPVWSPRGDLVAFTKIQGGMFHIGVMQPDGSAERLLTRSYQDEAPTWSPNGRVLMFGRKRSATDRTRLYSIDITGYNEREIPTPLEASDPDWSALLR
ncbi:Tol-Pal system beta propeller repeat protein TolB [Marinivivus vitaminiproducens]|uniref:Tol-Pal system beta propeller repeat protein TolB n=1 Tax=Marinivivus vitaminiproducens TaxID=3035935 RepID=UPI0027AA92C7|nr:Tol-Pal system beta propeller repeat protein TolB [Geminicoccaceae bacterium SCSIO 64248]